MPRYDVVVEAPRTSSFRVEQVAGMFDLPASEVCREHISAELPDLSEPWQVGLIVGPSGSGKSTLARHVYGPALFSNPPWPRKAAVVDGFDPQQSLREVTEVLTRVGFSSPPSWLKPYEVLSVGQQFRCDLARALLSREELVVFDEFTSVVDRTVARVGAAAVSQAVRSGKFARRFVAVSCHRDIAQWLEPDWVCDLAVGTLSRRRLRRPRLAVDIARCDRAAWAEFAPHHYLSGALNPAARCYLGTCRVPASGSSSEACQGTDEPEQPVAFAALLNAIGRRDVWRISRLVVLPDFQGIGIGGAVSRALGEIAQQSGKRLSITTSHPAMVAHLRSARHWQVTRVVHGGSRWGAFAKRKNVHLTSRGRTVVSAQFVAGLNHQEQPEVPGDSP